MAEPTDPTFIAQRAGNGRADNDPDVFSRMVEVDMQVAGAADRQVE